MLRPSILVVIACALAGAAHAQTPPAPPPPADAPPSGSMPSFYPDRAQRMEVNGRAVINCGVTPQGKLIDCKLVSETPADYGFGEAALKMSAYFKMKPSPTPIPDDRVTIPIAFDVPR